jgi:hypothetical protein
LVVAQTARLVINDVAQQGAQLADFQQLVDLLLVFDKSQRHFGIRDRKHAFGCDRILVKRHGDGPQRLGGQHGGVKARPVRADHHHVLSALQAQRVHAAGHALDHLGQRRPAVRLPDAVFLFAHGRSVGPLGGMLQQ